MTTIEEWRSVPSEPLLEASSKGRIRSIPYEVPMPHGGLRTCQVSPTYGVKVQMSPRYHRMQLTFRRKTYRLHRLVAEAFLGPCPKGLDVSHKDEDATNNIPDNLEYVTRKVNLNKPGIKKFHSASCRYKMQGMTVPMAI